MHKLQKGIISKALAEVVNAEKTKQSELEGQLTPMTERSKAL
ncbi:hypothetical protein [Psychrobacter piscatorii]